MVENERAALRLAHPTVVPDAEGDVDPDADDERKRSADVDVTGNHPTVRATPFRGD